MNGTIRILLTDDHLVVRMGIASILSFEDDMEVVGETDNGEDAVALARARAPDVVVMDLQMPRLGGADATARIRRVAPGAKVLVLTTYGTSADLKRAFDNGAAGALVKSSSQSEILAAIRCVHAGGRAVSPEIACALRDLRALPDLSPRQVEILNLIAKGFSNREIADALGLSVDTVKDHLKKTFSRMGVATRAEAVSLALGAGLITG